MPILDEVLAANDAYAADFGAKGELGMPPARGFAILTCMDARLDPAKYAGLAEGDAHVIRNAGGRASDDAIRSLVISHKLLGTAEWFVIHHTNCGMEFFTSEIMGDLLESSLETAALGDEGFYDVGDGSRLVRGQEHRLADDLRSAAGRRRRRRRDSQPPARGGHDPGLRLHLPRRDGASRRGRRGHRGRSPERDGQRIVRRQPAAAPGPSERVRRRASAGSARHRQAEALGLRRALQDGQLDR